MQDGGRGKWSHWLLLVWVCLTMHTTVFNICLAKEHVPKGLGKQSMKEHKPCRTLLGSVCFVKTSNILYYRNKLYGWTLWRSSTDGRPDCVHVPPFTSWHTNFRELQFGDPMPHASHIVATWLPFTLYPSAQSLSGPPWRSPSAFLSWHSSLGWDIHQRCAWVA